MNKYKSYNRIHKFENKSDVEKSKIKGETQKFLKLNKKTSKISDNYIKITIN